MRAIGAGLASLSLLIGGFAAFEAHLLRADGLDEDLRLGGSGTVFIVGPEAFATPFPGLQGIDRLRFSSGNSLFTSNWVSAPASAAGRDGLGPLFNARACASCHLEDGRGAPPEAGQEAERGLLFRISGSHHAYGDQIQNFALPGVEAEASITVQWEESPVALQGGQTVSLRKPIVTFSKLAYGPLPLDLTVSPRLAPPMIGLGLLEAIDPSEILAMADPDDKDQNGISGRPNYVLDHASGTKMLGRFGWKANQPSLRQQSAGAFLGDMGLTSSVFPRESCEEGQKACSEAPNGGSPEVEDKQLDLIVHYSRFLSVPARRNAPEVRTGRQLFIEANCQGCHRASMQTGADAAHPLLANQKIWPYTDLLLHDMGDELADFRPDQDASGTEWRTPPLWGLGMNEVVNKHRFFLHDGRARTIEEAILWHGGEATASREFYKSLTLAQREQLLAFLQSL